MPNNYMLPISSNNYLNQLQYLAQILKSLGITNTFLTLPTTLATEQEQTSDQTTTNTSNLMFTDLLVNGVVNTWWNNSKESLNSWLQEQELKILGELKEKEETENTEEDNETPTLKAFDLANTAIKSKNVVSNIKVPAGFESRFLKNPKFSRAEKAFTALQGEESTVYNPLFGTGTGVLALEAWTLLFPELAKLTATKAGRNALIGLGMNGAENFAAEGLTEAGKQALTKAIPELASNPEVAGKLFTEIAANLDFIKLGGALGILGAKGAAANAANVANLVGLGASIIGEFSGHHNVGKWGNAVGMASDLAKSIISAANPVLGAAIQVGDALSKWTTKLFGGLVTGVNAGDQIANSLPIFRDIAALTAKTIDPIKVNKDNISLAANSYAGTLNRIDKFNEEFGGARMSSVFAGNKLKKTLNLKSNLNDNYNKVLAINDASEMLGNTIKNNLDLYENFNNIKYNGGLKYNLMFSGKHGLKFLKPKIYFGIKAPKIEYISINPKSNYFDTVPKEEFLIIHSFKEDIHSFKGGGELINKYEQGKNIIPEGALHARRHHMEDDKNITKKGIPVVFNGELQAEIECNEIIFRKEVSEKIEKYWKDGSDEAAIKCGELLVKEILYNTQDYTGLIDTIEALKKGGTVKSLIAKNQQKRKNSQISKLRGLMIGSNIPIHRNVTGGVSFLAQPTNLPLTDNSIDALEFALMLLKQDPNLSNQLMEILKAFIQEYADLGKHDPQEWALAFQEFAQQYNLL